MLESLARESLLNSQLYLSMIMKTSQERVQLVMAEKAAVELQR